MSKYVITTSSTIDLNKDLLNEYKVNFINNIYYLDEEEYYDDINKEGHAKEFYTNLANGKSPKTTQINADRFIKYFETFLNKGLDLLHISFSSGLSGTYNSARMAVEFLNEKYPDRTILLVDSLAASSGLGLLVTEALDKQIKGYDVFQVKEYIEDIKLSLNHWFYSTDLTYYIKGGRVSRTSGFIGDKLNICPILNVSNEGKLIPRSKVIGKRRVLSKTLEIVNKNIENGNDYNKSIYISHSNILEDALKAKDLILKTYPNVKRVIINDIGPLVGSHSGPGTLAIFFFGNKRLD